MRCKGAKFELLKASGASGLQRRAYLIVGLDRFSSQTLVGQGSARSDKENPASLCKIRFRNSCHFVLSVYIITVFLVVFFLGFVARSALCKICDLMI